MKEELCHFTSISFHTVVVVSDFNCIICDVIFEIRPLTAKVTFCFEIKLHLDPILKDTNTTQHFHRFSCFYVRVLSRNVMASN
jgi:hypothetical protein